MSQKPGNSQNANHSLFKNHPIFKHTENVGLDGNRNPPEDVDTIKLSHPVSIYPHETKTKWDGP